MRPEKEREMRNEKGGGGERERERELTRNNGSGHIDELIRNAIERREVVEVGVPPALRAGDKNKRVGERDGRHFNEGFHKPKHGGALLPRPKKGNNVVNSKFRQKLVGWGLFQLERKRERGDGGAIVVVGFVDARIRPSLLGCLGLLSLHLEFKDRLTEKGVIFGHDRDLFGWDLSPTYSNLKERERSE